MKPEPIADVYHPPLLTFAIGKKKFVIVVGITCNNKRPNNVPVENGAESLAFFCCQCRKEIQHLLDVRHLVVIAFLVGILHRVSHERHQGTVIRQIDVGFFALAKPFEGLQLFLHHTETFVEVIPNFCLSIGDNIRCNGFEKMVFPVSIAVKTRVIVAVDDGVVVFFFQFLRDVVEGGGILKEER